MFSRYAFCINFLSFIFTSLAVVGLNIHHTLTVFFVVQHELIYALTILRFVYELFVYG